jgi:hypothetical protein
MTWQEVLAKSSEINGLPRTCHDCPWQINGLGINWLIKILVKDWGFFKFLIVGEPLRTVVGWNFIFIFENKAKKISLFLNLSIEIVFVIWKNNKN